MATLFTRIIRGEIPSYKLHDDEHTYSFLARDAIQPGHLLIVPKVEADHFLDVPEPFYSAVFRNARILGKALQTSTGCKRVGSMIAGWDVPHFHLHVVPMWDPSDLSFSKARVLEKDQYLAAQKGLLDALALLARE